MDAEELNLNQCPDLEKRGGSHWSQLRYGNGNGMGNSIDNGIGNGNDNGMGNGTNMHVYLEFSSLTSTASFLRVTRICWVEFSMTTRSTVVLSCSTSFPVIVTSSSWPRKSTTAE